MPSTFTDIIGTRLIWTCGSRRIRITRLRDRSRRSSMPDFPPNIPSTLRRDYIAGKPLLESDVLPDPIEQFARWFGDATDAGLIDANAMTLATADASGVPSARIVLLKGFDARGFTFFSNYNSRKGRELAENANAALVFYWQPLERQVRIEGTVHRVGRDESE